MAQDNNWLLLECALALPFAVGWRTTVSVRWLAHLQPGYCMAQDNNWLLLECVLALPFAVGWRTTAVARLLGLVLVAEAVTCWPVWDTWPSWCAQPRLHWGV